MIVPREQAQRRPPVRASDRVHQAQGMVSVQAGCSLEAALALMQATARETDNTLDEVADEVISRRLRYD
jgi:AmiR/NasT family two-component response regulator